MAASTDPKEEALKYLQKNKVLELFELIGARLAYAKPANPNEFLVAELTKIAEMRAAGKPVTLFEEAELVTMFAIFDITGKGVVNRTQYCRALEAVGINPNENVNLPKVDAIDKSTFVRYLKAEIQKRAL